MQHHGRERLSRRHFLSGAAAAGLGGLAMTLRDTQAAETTSPQRGAPGSDRRPNILWLMTDEHRWDAIRAYGRHAWVRSPHLDALAAEGVLFSEAYCQSPLCVGSRVSMLTGRYPHHTGVYGFEHSHPQTPFGVPFFTELLHAAGYVVVSFGKEHHYRVASKETPYDKTGKWYTLVQAFPDKDYQPRWRDNIREATPSELLKGADREEELNILRRYLTKKKLIIGGTNPVPADQTLSAHLSNMAIRYLQEEAPRDRPVFLRVSHIYPHTPHLPPEPFDTMYDPRSIPFPEVDEAELAAMGAQTRFALENLRVHGMKQSEIRQMRAHYFGLAAYVDQQLGRVIEAFKAFCQDRPWLIVFNPDHGCKLGEHGMHEKFTFYDESVHVPLIAASSDGRLPRGDVCGRFVELVDLAPTFLNAAGMPLPEYLDGFDLADIVAGRAQPRTEVISEKKTYGRRAMLRTERWSFEMQVSPEPVNQRPLKPEEMAWARTSPLDQLDASLFDRREDRAERRNLPADPAHKDLCEELRQRLTARVFPPDRVEHDWRRDVPPPPNAASA